MSTRYSQHVMNTYASLPVAFEKGDGCRLYDAQGKEYLDGLAGIAVSTLGHNHPALVSALSRQASALLHCSNLYRIPQQEQLAGRLCTLSGLEEAFFCNSGCEANETAIKLARLYGKKQGVELPTIVVMEQAFHGRSIATLSATGNRKAQAGFEPLVDGFVRVPYNDLAAVEAVAVNHHNIVAVMLEAIQGEGGIRLADRTFQRALHKLCEEREWLMIYDEVQCGMGRTGRWFGYQHAEVLPDIVTLAKGLGSGLPLGACLAGGRASRLFEPGKHGSTFGGNPLACTAALATLDAIEQEALISHAEHLGEIMREGFRQALDSLPGVLEIRGAGLMVGIELDRPCAELAGLALEEGLLINVTAEKIIRLLPPLVMSDTEGLELVKRLSQLVHRYLTRSLT